jgi:hypothetical protein
VPFFGDLPLVGWLFKNNATATGRRSSHLHHPADRQRTPDDQVTLIVRFAALRPGPPGRFSSYNAVMKRAGNLYLVGMMGAGKTTAGACSPGA